MKIIYFRASYTEKKTIRKFDKHVLLTINKNKFVSTFHRIEMLLLDSFQYCSSEYHLINWLTKNNKMSKIKQFNINNKIKLLI